MPIAGGVCKRYNDRKGNGVLDVGKEKEGLLEGAARDGNFLLLRTISHFTYEMVDNPGRNCHGWQFQEKRTRMSFFSAPDGSTTDTHFISKI